jgi:hypothetical protein
VLSTFARSRYLDVDGQIVALVTPDLLNGPLNIVLDAAGGLFGAIAPGAPLTSTPDTLHMAPGIDVALHKAETWNPNLHPWTTADAVVAAGHLRGLRTLLTNDAPADGLAHTTLGARAPEIGSGPVVARALPGLGTLTAGLAHRNPAQLVDAAGQLAGLGGGLTPSGDDVLVGVLLACSVWPSDVRALRDGIGAAASKRTTRISAAYLTAAAAGEANEAWHELMGALGTPDSARVMRAARRVIAFGETSGSEMLAGFVLAVTALLA